MTREIKFRAWDASTKEMHRPEDRRHDTVLTASANILKHYDCVMQYTGFKDKDGKEIYEGDVLMMITKNSMSDMEVKFVNGCFVGEGPFNTHPLSAYLESLDFLEWSVIGHIHENPELLS